MYCSNRCCKAAYKARKRTEKVNEAEKKVKNHLNFKPPQLDPTNLNSKEILTVNEAAKILGVERTTAYRYCVSGVLNCRKVNRKILIRRIDIDKMFEDNGEYEVGEKAPIKPITEFYTMDEITEKFCCAKSTVHKAAGNHNFPKMLYRGKNLYSKKHIDNYFSKYNAHPDIAEWYTVEEIMDKYSLTKSAIYSYVSTNNLPRKTEKGKSLYSKQHIDEHYSNYLAYDETITEWYSMEEIAEKFQVTKGYAANIVHKNPVPRKRVGNRSFYSKKHFDKMMDAVKPPQAYYYLEEAMEKFDMTRDSLYYHIKTNGIDKVKDGKRVKVLKSALDKLFEHPKIERYGNHKSYCI